VPDGRRSNIEDVWLYLHLMFELIWRYRFFYRDLNDLLSRNRKLELHFKQILAHKIKVARQLCEDLRSDGAGSVGRPRSTRWRPTWWWWRPTGCRTNTCAIRANIPSSRRWRMPWRAAATRCCP
jgi:hypothetical protein